MKIQSNSDAPLRQEWEALGRQIERRPGFTDDQLAVLYERVRHMPPVECPELPVDERAVLSSCFRTVSLAAVAVLLMFLLPLPRAMAMGSDNDRAACEKTVSMMIAKAS